jgi:DNA helicase HerA-like ATPase
MGSSLISKLLDLSDTQAEILDIIFDIADDEEKQLNSINDLRNIINELQLNKEKYNPIYGTITTISLDTIKRKIRVLEKNGGNVFFNKNKTNLNELITIKDNKGLVNVLDSTTLINSPSLYATFLIWLLSELYNTLPEVGDIEKPKFILFFDEAHLLFNDMPKVILQKIEQMVRLIRSKGIGIIFCTQLPSDIPDTILSQLNTKIIHKLIIFTPTDKTKTNAIAQALETDYITITTLPKGEAIISTLNENAQPYIIPQSKINAPNSGFTALTEEEKARYIVRQPIIVEKIKQTVKQQDDFYERSRIIEEKYQQSIKEYNEIIRIHNEKLRRYNTGLI